MPAWRAGAAPGGRIESVLRAAGESSPERVALLAGETTVTFAELAAWASRIAAGLRAHGVEPGDRVAVFLDKTPACVAALYGSWWAGAVLVPINESLRARQVSHIAGNSGAKVLVTTPRKLRMLGEGVELGSAVVADVDQLGAGDGSFLAPADLAGGAAPAAILYTSGSTGRPKGILITHDNLLAGSRIVTGYLGLTPEDRILSVLPFSFDYGLNQLLDAVLVRATLVLQRSLLPAEICRTLERRRITVLAGVPPLWIELMSGVSPLSGMQLPDLRLITNSGGAFPVDLVKQYRQTFPHLRIFLMYGLSEAFRSTYLPPEEVDRRPGSMGKAIPECEILVLDDENRRCPPGQPGQLVHRGPTVSAGYWQDPETTARVFRPDPEIPGGVVVYSGDVVRTDEDGFLYFVGRRDEMIKSQGYRISPTEVEEIVYESGMAREVVAAGEPDETAGAVVVIHVVPADPASFQPEALLEHCRREMPRYMVPRRVYAAESFPRTASGKIDRKQVKAGAVS